MQMSCGRAVQAGADPDNRLYIEEYMEETEPAFGSLKMFQKGDKNKHREGNKNNTLQVASRNFLSRLMVW